MRFAQEEMWSGPFVSYECNMIEEEDYRQKYLFTPTLVYYKSLKWVGWGEGDRNIFITVCLEVLDKPKRFKKLF